jgi:hypothetical protein
MSSDEPCWASSDVSFAAAILGRLLITEDRVRRCLGGGAP